MVHVFHLRKCLTLYALLAVIGTGASRPLKGVSEFCAEWGTGPGSIPGTVDKTYTWPKASSIEHFAAAGFGVIRVPFLWERLQPTVNGASLPVPRCDCLFSACASL